MSVTGLPNKLKSSALANNTSWLTKNGRTLKAEYQSRFPIEVDYILAVYVIILWTVALYANGAIVMRMQGKSAKRRPVNSLLGYLAFSNGLQAITTFPFQVVAFLCHWWALGDTGCSMYAFAELFFSLTSPWILLAVAIAAHPSTLISFKGSYITQQKKIRLVFRVFLLIIYNAALFACMLPFLGIGRYEAERAGVSCGFNWAEAYRELPSYIYVTCVLSVGFLLPFIGVAGLFISIRLKYHSFRGKPPVKAGNDQEEQQLGASSSRRSPAATKVLWMALTVCACQILSRIPSLVLAAYSFYSRSNAICPLWIEFFASLLAKTSTALTPVTQLCFTKTFRRCLKKCFCCCCMTHRSSIRSSRHNASVMSNMESADCSVCALDGTSGVHRTSSKFRLGKAPSSRQSARTARQRDRRVMDVVTVVVNPEQKLDEQSEADQICLEA